MGIKKLVCPIPKEKRSKLQLSDQITKVNDPKFNYTVRHIKYTAMKGILGQLA